MPLPKIEHPIIEVYVHSLDKKVKFRPFLVKEERILMMAKESDDPVEIQDAVVQIVNNCVLDDVDVTKLPLFDVEMIFVKLRAISVGSTIQLSFHCNNEVDGVKCDTDNDYQLSLDKIRYEIPEGHTNKVMLSDKVGIMLKYPTLETSVANIDEDEEDEEKIYAEILNTLLGNVDYIFDAESVYKPAEMSKDELREFFDNLTVEKMREIENFFGTSPRVLLEDEVVCKKCGFNHKLRYEGLSSFFI